MSTLDSRYKSGPKLCAIRFIYVGGKVHEKMLGIAFTPRQRDLLKAKFKSYLALGWNGGHRFDNIHELDSDPIEDWEFIEEWLEVS